VLRFQTFGPLPTHRNRRQVPNTGGRFFFDEEDILRFQTPQSLLNDACINGTAALLQQMWTHPGEYHESDSRRCAIFSTFDLHMARYNCPISETWRRTSHLEYWRKDIWLLPIHRLRPAGHWVLAVILISSRKIYLFDSLAAVAPWRHEIGVSNDSFSFQHRINAFFLSGDYASHHAARSRVQQRGPSTASHY